MEEKNNSINPYWKGDWFPNRILVLSEIFVTGSENTSAVSKKVIVLIEQLRTIYVEDVLELCWFCTVFMKFGRD